MRRGRGVGQLSLCRVLFVVRRGGRDIHARAVELVDLLSELGWLSRTAWVQPVLPSLAGWRTEARIWARWARLDVKPVPSLAALRGQWRHLVGNVPPRKRPIPRGSVYVEST